MDTNSFIVYIKNRWHLKRLPEDVETGFDTLNYGIGRPLSKGIKKSN